MSLPNLDQYVTRHSYLTKCTRNDIWVRQAKCKAVKCYLSPKLLASPLSAVQEQEKEASNFLNISTTRKKKQKKQSASNMD